MTYIESQKHVGNSNSIETVLVHVDVDPQQPSHVAFACKKFTADGGCCVIDITNHDLLNASGKGKLQLNCGPYVTVRTRNSKDVRKSLSNYYQVFEAPLSSFLIVIALSTILTLSLHSYYILALGSTSKAMVHTILNMFLISIVVHRTVSLWSLQLHPNTNKDFVTLDIEIDSLEQELKTNSSTLDKSHVDHVDSRTHTVSPPKPTNDEMNHPTINEATTANLPTESNKPKHIEESEDIVPFRFIKATKGDFEAAKLRWRDTLSWRKQMKMNFILQEPHPKLKVIKEHYPHFFHLRGRKNECCYYESPPKMNLEALKKEGLNIDDLLKHYALCTEYMWKEVEPSEDGKSIYVIDLEGIRLFDFAGEVIDFVKRASALMAAHYPERSGSIFVINVPTWFSVIWNVVRPLVDEVTQQKITILRVGLEGITKALEEKIAIENIPPEYGGKSMPLGYSPEDQGFMMHFEKINKDAAAHYAEQK